MRDCCLPRCIRGAVFGEIKLVWAGMIMAMIGGAIITPAQGALLDMFGVSLSYLLPLACFALIFLFARTAARRA